MIDEVIKRLEGIPELKMVGGAAAFQVAAENNPAVTPCAFVIPLEEIPSAGIDATIVIQKVVATIGLVFVVRNVADRTGAAAAQDLAVLRNAAKAVLLGWEPVDGYAPLERGPSNLLVFKDGHMWWQDIYVTDFYERSEQ